LRICMITTFYPPYHTGGCGIHVHQLSNSLSQQGHQVEVIHCVNSYFTKRRTERKGRYEKHPKLKVHRIKSRAGRIAPALTYLTGYPLLVGKEIKRILSKGFDVIHYHNISLFGGPAVLSFGDAIKLFTLHTYWLICPTHYLWKFNYKICRIKECLKCMVFYKKQPPQLWRYSSLRDEMLKNVDALIAPSQFLKRKHLEEGIESRLEWISNFVPPPRQNSMLREENIVPEVKNLVPYFLYVGRLEFYKGVQVLIKAYNEKRRKNKLLVAGDGTYSQALKLQAKNNPNIVFLGRIPPEKLRVLYANALALIVPSLWYENSSIAVLEATSHGLPIITTGNGGLREVVEGNKAGIVYGTTDELVDALERVEEESNLRDKLAANALKAYQKYYTPEAYLGKYYDLIGRLSR
jgi:glycosyltransferase involved in cell wall biosynthesis